MTKAANFTLLVNTSDGFEDCWQPFFHLLTQHWPHCDIPILLNTENKDWSYPNLSICCTRVQACSRSSQRLSWSECLLAALEQVKTPIVLYMQEDYFVEKPIDVDLIQDLAVEMMTRPEIKHIGLTHFGSEGPFEVTEDPRLWRIPRRGKYRVSTQAGLWRVDTLRSYLCPGESGWMFEIFGTRRAWKREELFMTLNRDLFGPRSPAIYYLHTGILKGKWHAGIPEVFARHGIVMDFQRRGFYQPKPWLLRKVDVARKLAKRPLYALKALMG